jgi:N-methylhydantoinase A/oxoprolinase/acetone carboxylase beta subunit
MVRVMRPKVGFPGVKSAPEAAATRPMHFDGVRTDTTVHRAGALKPGDRISGPSVITEATTNIVLPPGTTAHVTSAYYMIEVSP